MESRQIHHSRLEKLNDLFRKEPTPENSELLIAGIVQLISSDAEIIAAGKETQGRTMPEGYYAPDGKFYFHIFTGKDRLAEGPAENSAVVRIRDLYRISEGSPSVGGFSLNPSSVAGTTLITKEDISGGLEIYHKLHAGADPGKKGQTENEE